MAEDYAASTAKEAEKFREALNSLDLVLASDLLPESETVNVSDLRRKVKEALVNLRTDVESLRDVKSKNFYGTDPTLSLQERQLVRSIESQKVGFEFEIVPAFRKLARETVEKAKENPPPVPDKGSLPAPPPGEEWTAERVVDTAEKFINQAEKAGGVIAKAYTFAKALGLLVGIPLP